MSDSYPAQWAGRTAIVTLPQHVGECNASRIRDQLLLVINRGATELVADMTGTVWRDQEGAAAAAHAYQRAPPRNYLRARLEPQLNRHTEIGTGTMISYNATDSRETGNWPQVRSGPLMVGGVLIGIGAVVAIAGVAVAGTHLTAATRAWIKELETPPGQLARLKWEQARSAAAAGAAGWRDHPNAKIGLARRASSA
jgi:hypothetical protein